MMDDRSSVVACLKIAMYLTWLLGYGYNGYTVSHIAYLQILQYMAILTLFTNPYRIDRVQRTPIRSTYTQHNIISNIDANRFGDYAFKVCSWPTLS